MNFLAENNIILILQLTTHSLATQIIFLLPDSTVFLNILTKVLYNICKQKTVAVLFWVENVYFVVFLAGEKYGYISQLWLVASCLFSSWSFSVILSQSRYSGVRADDTVVYLSDGTFSYSKLLVQIVFDLNTEV